MSDFFFFHHQAELAKAEENINQRRRQAAAARIKQLRQLELHSDEYIRDSSLREYLISAGGLATFLNVIRGTSQPRLLDIGTGTGKAASELGASHFGAGIESIGTTLARRSKHSSLSRVPISRTSAEILRGIDNRSVGGILSLKGMAYAEPTLAVASADRVLAPGGIIKGTFKGEGYSPEWEATYEKWGLQPADNFATELAGRGYDVALNRIAGADDILVACKPARDGSLADAAEILETDLETLPEQLAAA